MILDEWLVAYNFERTHQVRNCEDMNPMECFEKSKHLAKIKMIGCNSTQSQDTEKFLEKLCVVR